MVLVTQQLDLSMEQEDEQCCAQDGFVPPARVRLQAAQLAAILFSQAAGHNTSLREGWHGALVGEDRLW